MIIESIIFNEENHMDRVIATAWLTEYSCLLGLYGIDWEYLRYMVVNAN